MRSASPIMISAEALSAFTVALFTAAGCDARESRLVADHLVEANLQGHDSHGVGMAPAYIRNIGSGALPLGVVNRTILDTGGLLLLDAGQGLGQVAAHDAMEAAIARARDIGACSLLLRDSHHVGRVGHWAEQAARAGMVAILFVNVPGRPRVAPFGGLSARFGTNPVAIGVPRPDRPPVIVDFATSRFAVGKVRVAMNKGESLPEGILIDADGKPTLDPSALFAEPSGALLPFGDHKGFGLALAVELLAGALSGGPVADGQVRSTAIINNMLAIVIAAEALGSPEERAARIETFLDWVRAGQEGNAVLIPGDPERMCREQRLRDGIPIDPATWAELAAASASVCAPAPRPE